MDGISEPAGGTSLSAARRLFDVAEYRRMAEVGILLEDDRIELIEGELLVMASVGGPHISTVMALTRLLIIGAGDRAMLSVQSPVRLDRYNEPEPDLALLHNRADCYRRPEPPLATDVLLLIEVSDTTLRYDRGIKLPLYARFGIPEAWIIDISGRAIDVFRDPLLGGYGSVKRAVDGDRIEPLGLPGVELSCREILGQSD